MFSCCGSKPKKQKTEETRIEPKTQLNSDTHSLKNSIPDKDEFVIKKYDNDTVNQSTQHTSLPYQEQQMHRVISQIRDLRKINQLEKSRNIEQEYIQNLIQDDSYPSTYILIYKWAVNYTHYLKGSQKGLITVPPIDNSVLLKQETMDRVVISDLDDPKKCPLKTHLKSEKDYVLLNQKAWQFVKTMYGGGPEIFIDIDDNQKQFQDQKISKTVEIKRVETQPQSRFIQKNTQNQNEKQNQNEVQNSYQIQKTQTQTQTQTQKLTQTQTQIQVQSQSQLPKSVERQVVSSDIRRENNINLENKRNGTTDTRKPQSESQIQSPIKMSGTEFQIVGLQNPRFYCYMNAALQCLLSIPVLNEKMSQLKGKGKFIQAYQDLLRKINQGSSKGYPVVAAQSIWNICAGKFQFHQQQDSHEFLLYLLDQFQEELVGKYKNKQEFKSAQEAWNDYTTKNNDIIDYMFAGQITSQSYCKACKKYCEGYDPIWDLSIPLNKSFLSRDCDLKECLKSYFKEETINDVWQCDKCKKQNRSVQRKTQISQTPRILILQIKRFTTFPKNSKITDGILYPMFLDMGEFCAKEIINTKYRLKALISHMGQINGGHYTACASRGENWYQFDDESVYRLKDGKQTLEKQGYIFFYEKV